MKFAITRVVIGCLCGAAALIVVGCGEVGRMPTSPTASGTIASVAGNTPGTGGSAPQSVAATKPADNERPFKGSLSLELVGEPVFEPPSTVSVHFAGTGNATHLGRFTAMLDLKIDVSEEPMETSRGTITFISANGDSVFGTVTGHARAEGDVTTIFETVTITGGTGRFADTTGTFIIKRESLAGMELPGSFEGVISY